MHGPYETQVYRVEGHMPIVNHITYQFGVHQFWRNLFYVLGQFLIWGIDIINSPFLVTVLDYSF